MIFDQVQTADVESILRGTTPIICSFSGGRTSAMMTITIAAMKGAGLITAPVEYIFMDTGAEHPKTYEFLKKVVDFAGIDLTCLRAVFGPPGQGVRHEALCVDEIGYDLTVWKKMLAKHSTPYTPSGGFCTTRMKQEPAIHYLNAKYGKGGYTQALGMRIDEPRRLLRNGKKKRFYMADILPDVEKIDVLMFWRRMPFDLEIPEWLGNCVFCVKKRPNKIALAAMDAPDLADDFWRVLTSPDVKLADSGRDPLVMYRDYSTLDGIRRSFDGIDRGEIIARLRATKIEDEPNSCSESCEVIFDDGDGV